MEVLYSSNMVCIGVRGKIPNSPWYCLSPAFLCIFYSRNTAVRTASMSGNELIYRSGGGGWEGELWMKRNGITTYCMLRRYNYVIITMLLLNYCNLIAMQGTSGYDYRNTLNALLR
jgi:hypothetical protein